MKFVNRWDIRKRLLALSMTGFALTLMVGGIGYLGVRQVNRANANVVMVGTATRNHLEGDMMHDALRADFLATFVATSEAERNQVKGNLAEHAKWFRDSLARNRALPLSPDAKGAIEASAVELERYIATTEFLIELALKNPAAARLRMKEFNTAFEHLEEKNEKLSTLLEQEAATINRAAESGASKSLFFLVLITLASAMALVTLAWYITNTIARPLAEFTVQLENLARGDLSQRIATAETAGELARMGDALNGAIDGMRQAVRTIHECSAEVGSGSENMRNLSQHMATAAEDTARNANIASDAGGRVEDQLSAVAKSSSEMVSAIREIADQSSAAARMAAETATTAASASELVAMLGRSSSEIGEVVRMISSIAEQTNLLALNATIEAARAGAAGKGFAVVANEVKGLATQTAQATESVTARIRAIQEQTVKSVEAIKSIAGKVESINHASAAIAAAVEQQTASTKTMEGNLAGAASSSAEISQSVSSFATSAQETSRNAAESATAAEQLLAVSATLKESVARFRLA